MTKKYTFISDTHNKHNHLTSNAYNNILGSGDVLIHAGDCTSMGKSHEITNFLNWFAMTDFKHKIFIAGNHDFGFELHTDIADEFKERGIIYLYDSEVVIDGVKFYGSPWQPEFYDCFNGVEFLNASVLNEKYEYENKPIKLEFDVNDKKIVDYYD